ncbi:hypothetical protein GpartN1_g377.t1 [Galdieria partita]|uniref:Uncharacterized protein n=1 Tax=Galdieria partita TaxID=83374 RepID=A0A9C7PQM4_9RHOD|nr:hypothetical protein GpartN1_g377.t1 [Galdieria partita]
MVFSGFVLNGLLVSRSHFCHFPHTAYKGRPLFFVSYSFRYRPNIGLKLVASKETVKQPKWPKDEKGDILWSLRRATENDLHFIVSHSNVLTPSLVKSLIENGLESCMVAQVGEDLVGYSLFAIERVPTDPKRGFESPLQTNAIYVTSFRLPSVPIEIESKLILGSLKMLKSRDCLLVSADVAVGEVERESLLQRCGFQRGKEVEKDGGVFIEYRMNLVASNVDPQKKIG